MGQSKSELTPYQDKTETKPLATPHPRPGAYWEVSEPYDLQRKGDNQQEYSLNPGEFVLITDVHTVEDDEIHSVTLYYPPRITAETKWKSLKITIGKFRQYFIPTDEDVLAKRQQEMAQALRDFNEISSDVSGRITQAVDTTHDSAEGSTNTRAQIAQINTTADRIQNEIDEIHTTLTPRAERIHKLVQAISGELVAQVQASLHQPQKLVKRLNRVVTSLESYSGDDVEVVQIRTGTPAPQAEPISIYQSMRYMDEEYILHLAEGGADYKDWEGFVDHLVKDESVLDRLIPAKRGMCVMRYRRKERIYYHAQSYKAYMDNAKKNERNLIGFLLYRDGGNAWTIDSPVTAHDIPSLFPTQAQITSPFSGFLNTTVKFEDLQYKRSFDEAQRKLFAYQNLVIVLWGLQDRTRLFPNLPTGDFGEQIQNPNLFQWVSDDEYLITDGKENLIEWLRKNSTNYLMSGMRVFCNWRYLKHERSNRILAKADSSKILTGNQYDVLVAQQDGNDFYVKVPVRISNPPKRFYEKEDLDEKGNRSREFNAKINITAYQQWLDWNGMAPNESTAYVIMDAVRAEDVTRFIHSREARKHYLTYIDTFIALREFLEKDEAEQEDMKEAVKEESKVDHFDEKWHTAVRLWRAARRGRQIPTSRDDPEFDKVLKNLHKSVVISQDENPKPTWVDPSVFMVTTSSGGHYYTYQKDVPQETSCIPSFFTKRERWRLRKNQPPIKESSARIKFKKTHTAKESLVWKEGDLAQYSYPETNRYESYDHQGSWVDRLTPDMWTRLHDVLRNSNSDGILTGDCDTLFQDYHHRWLNTVFIRPLASRYYVHKNVHECELRILCYLMHPLQWFYRYGSDDQRETIRKRFNFGDDDKYWTNWRGKLCITDPIRLLEDYRRPYRDHPCLLEIKRRFFPRHRPIDWEHKQWMDYLPDETLDYGWSQPRKITANPKYDQIYATPELSMLHEMFGQDQQPGAT